MAYDTSAASRLVPEQMGLQLTLKCVKAEFWLLTSCATRHVTFAILSRDKVARQNLAIKLQVWHRSKCIEKLLLICYLPTTLMVQVEHSVRCVWKVTFELNVLWSRYLPCWLILTLSRSSAKIKVAGQSSLTITKNKHVSLRRCVYFTTRRVFGSLSSSLCKVGGKGTLVSF